MVVTKNIDDVYPLSPMQAGMLFHSLLAPESGVYCEQTSFELHGALNVPAFVQAWQQVIARHPILRTGCVWENLEKPLQVVGRQVKFPWQEEDWWGVEPKEQQQKLAALLIADRQRGFELSQAPLMRLLLIRLSEQVYHFTWSHHHILLDGWSVPIIFQEVITYYKAFCQSQNIYLESPRPYRDYIAWLQQQNLSQAEVFWRNILNGFTTPTPIGIKPITQHLTDNGEQEIKLSAVTTSALESLAKQHQLTLNTLVQGAWALLLNRYSSEEDIVFGATVSGRPPCLPKVEAMVGLFINTLPVRVQIDPEQFLLSWLKQLLAQQVEARQYEYTPLSEIQKWSDIPPGSPLFESIVVFENYPVEASLLEPDINLEIKNRRSFERTNYPLTMSAVPGEELLLKIAYQQSDLLAAALRYRLDSATIKRMLGHLQTLLVGMATNPHQRLKDLSLLTADEQNQLLIEWNNTQIDYPQDQCIHQLFEAQVEKTPNAVAVVFENEQLTYRELNTRANQLAHYLQKLGVIPEVLVGICVERSLEMIIGLLGILKAGGAYVPIDPAYPQERLGYMLTDAQVSVLLTQKHLLETLPAHNAQTLYLDQDKNLFITQSTANPISNTTSENLAYVIYTSGSTGKPKGAMNTHKGLCNRLLWMQDTYQLTASDRVLQKTPFSFDVSVWEFFWPLLTGASLVIAKPGGHQDSRYLVELIAQEKITTLHFVPSMLQVFLEETDLEKCGTIKQVICSGEALSFDLQKRFFERLNAELHNLYGPTEAAIDVTYWACQLNSNQKIVPIGRPIANIQIYILDKHLQPVPIGVSGELHIGGVGLARGYWNKPELTQEKFIASPFESAQFLYRTGDLARYLPNGNIEYLGRIDHQVKIRGFRIEVGEIETLLAKHPEIQESVVALKEDDLGEKRLVAYIVSKQNKLTTNELASKLQKFLQQKLPDYMIPSAFVLLEALPLTPNGKLDRRALLTPDWSQRNLEQNYISPRTPVEEIIANTWTQVLGVEQVGVNDNFFELGGHSLLATQLISRLRQVFQIELPLQKIFEFPTVADLATAVEAIKQAEDSLLAPPIVPVSRENHLPLSFAQQRLWFLEQLQTNNAAYNITSAVRVLGDLNITALEASLNEIIKRHEALRTALIAVEGLPMQVITANLQLSLPIIDLQALSKPEQETQVQQLINQETQQPFDLSQVPLLRVIILKLSSTEYVIIFTMHHIISDAWSMSVIIREIVALYPAFAGGKPFALPDLPIQYADFAVWQRQWLQGQVLENHLAYWKQKLGAALPVLKLPYTQNQAATPSNQAGVQTFSLSAELSEALKTLSRQENVTLFMTMVAALKTLLYRYTGQDDIVIGTDVANRNRGETEGLIGFFVNLLVLRTDISGYPTFRELLQRVRKVTLEAYAHQDLPFDKLVEELQPERHLSHTPLFQVLFVMDNVPTQNLQLPELTLLPIEVEAKIAKFDLALFISETESGIKGGWYYKTDLFAAKEISSLFENFQELLASITTQSDARINTLDLLTETQKQEQLITEVKHEQGKLKKLMQIKPKAMKLS
ncbi:non-ribosomal peptide synthetase [Anabaena catenula]|uniref:Amino acid adenylation domain-containing protein n=1 Tax=Anabaena catenula FACHB-362 TaxID=2692877 RepID=A0ABR8IWN9_9NOST|nr:non-ribosomal peptide synthetase [Anabaena catenula]MBD2690475.1 amino acid adenylation domain-containing protein [Anabaena catenula FACHB-362]